MALRVGLRPRAYQLSVREWYSGTILLRHRIEQKDMHILKDMSIFWAKEVSKNRAKRYAYLVRYEYLLGERIVRYEYLSGERSLLESRKQKCISCKI